MNTNKLFVAGISYNVSNSQLQDLFAQHGTVSSANIISDRMTGQSKGFGFVEMATNEEAQKAMDALNNTDFAGRTIVVNEAKPQVDRPRNNFSNSGSRDGGHDRNRSGGGDRRQNRW